MVLLTSSTVSVIVSTGVISIFTLLLFLSGYALQQQSVRSIQHAIRPAEHAKGHSLPVPLHKRNNQDPLAQPYLDTDTDTDTEPDSTGTYAYLQLLSTPDPSNICSAILFFKHLTTNTTTIQDRLFMYPQDWDTLPPHKTPPKVQKALSLLRTASKKYNIWLLPIDMTPATSAGYTTTDTKLLRLGQIHFMHYDGVLYLQTPGILLDTQKLDTLLTSHPLPLRHDKNRIDSYNNEAWIPMPLRADRDSLLPPVYLVTVNNIENGHVEARGHVPNLALEGLGHLVSGPWGVRNPDEDMRPAYVFFERGEDGRAKWEENPLFGSWRAQQSEVCEGLELDDLFYEDYEDDDGYDL